MAEFNIPVGMVRPYSTSQRAHSQVFKRRLMRDAIGPDNPLWHLLETLCIEDVMDFEDDFLTDLVTPFWATGETGTGTPFANLANTLGGVIRGTTEGADPASERLLPTNNRVWATNSRPLLVARVRQPTAITTSKFEVGFSAADQAVGQVNVKSTPSANGVDFAVIVRDTTDGTETSLASARAAAGIAVVDFSPAFTWAVDVFNTLAIALNEINESYAWINGIFSAVQRTAAANPADDTAIGPFIGIFTRSSAIRSFDVDYVKVVSERRVYSAT